MGKAFPEWIKVVDLFVSRTKQNLPTALFLFFVILRESGDCTTISMDHHHHIIWPFIGLVILTKLCAFVASYNAVQNATVAIVEQPLPYQKYRLLLDHPIHGERCDPKTDDQLFPIVDTFSSDKFLYCHHEKRVYDIGFCFDNVFDPLLRKCIAKTFFPMEQLPIGAPTMTAKSAANSTAMAETVPTSMKIFSKVKKERKAKASDQKMIGQRIGADGFGTDLKIRIENYSSKKMPEVKADFLAQNMDEMPKDGTDVKVLINMRGNSSTENIDKFEKKGKELSELMGQKSAKNGKSEVEIEGDNVRHFVLCSDGSLPFGDNNGRSHRCIPDYGHNPFSSFACPFSYRCEYSSVLRTHQCCPELVDANREKPFDEEYSAEDGDEGPNERQGERTTDNARKWGDFGRACPSTHFLRIHPKNGQPTLCSPSWLILFGHGGCPPFSKCVYSPSLLQFVCCQAKNLLKAMENELKIQNYAFYPPIGIFPGQSGCIDDGQCHLKFPGAKCQNWMCICPQGLSAYNGRCVINCPFGHSVDSNGICTSTEFEQKPKKYSMFWHKKK